MKLTIDASTIGEGDLAALGAKIATLGFRPLDASSKDMAKIELESDVELSAAAERQIREMVGSAGARVVELT